MPQRYFLDALGNFTSQDIHHIKNVMRMHTGDQVIICDFNHQCYLVSLKIDDSITYDVIATMDDKREPKITLIQGLPKGAKADFIVKSATLFGASHIIFVPFDRSIAKLENTTHKQNRYHTIAKEAAELSHRQSIPQITFIPKIKPTI